MATPAASGGSVGLRVRTGRVVAVALSHPVDRPRAVFKETVALTDPAVAWSGQPYHLGLELPPERAATEVARVTAATRRAGQSALARCFERIESRGVRLRAAVVVSDSATDPDSIHNPHMRAHALEGRLFCEIARDAARAHGLAPSVVLKRALRDTLDGALAGSQEIDAVLVSLGAALGRPWQADHKLAAMAAWLALLGGPARPEKLSVR